MNTSLVFTFIGADRPGLVERIAEQISAHQGSWQESRMVELAGQFAGIARVTVASDQTESLRRALQALSSEGLEITLQNSDSKVSSQRVKPCKLSVVGNDRPGIVHEISRALKLHQINVVEMSSNVTSAAMSGDTLFEALAQVELPATVNRDQLEDALDSIADQLSLDILVE
ncbi:glycine cleavage system protein R [Spongiibacter sp. KMU-158]|uniref:Glycine cleavage system transcriptional repressor n=1 Tax=Spongiibacter pelagi TaxID=2760804 RepID=A0A927C421_9GAMM|nr:ACT domain-containing protein [Spongiibacter pelagi]MBD2859627.1 glycine cleavage system protein R [Spongiibacter pelagi]